MSLKSLRRGENVLDSSHLVLECGSLHIGFPTEAVLGVLTWSPPRPLPGAASWVAGLLSFAGGVVPVMVADFWGGGLESPDVCLVVTSGGRELAVPGRSPWIAVRASLKTGSMPGEGPWAGELTSGDRTVSCVDVEKLYLALGLN